MTTDNVLLVSIADQVATVTLNRPGARNALSRDLRREIRHTMADLDANPEVAAIVLTGSDPAFCAGLDLKELAGTDGSEGAGLGETVAVESDTPVRAPFAPTVTPVIGAVNGVAITGGFELALACDFLIASERAAFADTHARVGIMPGWGLTVLLPEAIGVRRAKELSGTGNFLDAQTALDWGLVNRVVPHDEVVTVAQKLAADIAGNDAEAVRRIYQTYDEGALVDGAGAWAAEGEASREWQSRRTGDDLEARRKAVTERGRSQV